MAFDGITIAGVVSELNHTILGGRIYKIAQPESDELLLTVKNNSTQYRLLLSADASLPLIYLTEQNKQSPMTAPGFCMLLRKHLQNARITAVTQPGLERIVHLHLEHLNELGDICHKKLIVEIMGKHSNIIFCDDNDKIIDSIKHVSGMVSSVREVLPGRDYFIPHTQDKQDPLAIEDTQPGYSSFCTHMKGMPMPIYKALYTSYTGLSPIIAQEICYRAGVDSDLPANVLSDADSSPENAQMLRNIYQVLCSMMREVQDEHFSPVIFYHSREPIEFSAVPLTLYSEEPSEILPSISMVLEKYYAQKNIMTRIRQKSSDLRRIVQTALERNVKKYDLQLRQMKDTEKRDKYKLYGELLNVYGYDVAPDQKEISVLNYYTNENVTIPLDPTLSPQENAQKYFDRYGKLKRTYEALSELTCQVQDEIRHLESISAALDIAVQENDLVQIKEELIESGYIRRKGGSKKVKITSQPFHYLSSDGFHIYVGKNNYQNDELTFKFATGNDWWFHAKGAPGSHVIVKTEGQELPDRTFEEAARLAAFYSKNKGQDKIEIDYIQKKHVKKPAGAKPGFVVYYTNYSMMIDSDISNLKQL